MKTEHPTATEVHNVWTIYGVDEDGQQVAEPLAMASRPQNWGDPKWHYERFRFTWFTEEAMYINNCHCWTDMTLERGRYPELFAALIVQILMPGRDSRECDRRFLLPDDWWLSAWGKRPKIYDPSLLN